MRKAITIAGIALFVVFGSTAVFAGGAAEAPDDRVVRIALSDEPGSLDYHADTTTVSLDVGQAVYESLIRFDFNMEFQPWLAEDFEQLDEVTYRFWLREGIEFHSGNPFNAEAVKAHIDRMIDPDDPGLAKAYMDWIGDVVVVDEYTVDIIADEPYGPALAYLALPFNGIHDAKAAEEQGDLFGVSPSGTGPFVVDEWRRGTSIELSANENYWRGAPAVNGLEFRIIPEAGTRTMALQTAEVDVTTQLPPEAVQTLQDADGVNVIIEPEPRLIRWQLNVLDSGSVLSDINIRRALTYAIDYPMIIDAILEEYGRPLHGHSIPEQFGYLEQSYDYDPDEADRLLRESGWELNANGIYEKDGEELRIEVITGDKMARELELFEAMQSEFRDFGIDMAIDRIEGAQIYPEIVRYMQMGNPPGWDEVDPAELDPKPDFDIITVDLGMRTGETNIALENGFRSDGIRNPGGWYNLRYDELVDIAVSGAPEDERLEAYHDAQRILQEEVPTIHLWQPTWAMATGDYIEGFTLHPAGVWYYEEIEDLR